MINAAPPPNDATGVCELRNAPGTVAQAFAVHENALPLVQHNFRRSIADPAGLAFTERHICDARLFRAVFYQPCSPPPRLSSSTPPLPVILYPAGSRDRQRDPAGPVAAADAAALRGQRRAAALPARYFHLALLSIARPSQPPSALPGLMVSFWLARMCAQTPATPKPSRDIQPFFLF